MKQFWFCYTDEFGEFGIESVESDSEDSAWAAFAPDEKSFYVLAVAQGPVNWVFEA